MRRRRTAALVLGAAATGIVAIAGLAITATNTVPGSLAGGAASARTIAQLTPTQCSSNGVNPTNLVVGSSSPVNGANGVSNLILGPNIAGAVTINGGNRADCIVAGGGPGTTNTINGGAGADVCIGAPGAVNNFVSCAFTF